MGFKWRYLAVAWLVACSARAFACEIDVTTDKSEYKVGDTVIFKVLLTQQHKNCRKDAEEPAIKVSDKEIQIVAKTKIKKLAEGSYSISYKGVLKARSGSFVATRSCPDGGSTKTVTIEAKE